MAQDNDVLEYALQIYILFSRIQQSKSLTCPELPSVPAVSAIVSLKVCMIAPYRLSGSSGVPVYRRSVNGNKVPGIFLAVTLTLSKDKRRYIQDYSGLL